MKKRHKSFKFNSTRRLVAIAIPLLVLAIATQAYQHLVRTNIGKAFDLGGDGTNTYLVATSLFDKPILPGKSNASWSFGSEGKWSSKGDGRIIHTNSTKNNDFNLDFIRLTTQSQLNIGASIGFIASADNVPSLSLRCGQDQNDPGRMMLIVSNGSLVMTQHDPNSGPVHSVKTISRIPFALQAGTHYTIEFNSQNVTEGNTIKTNYNGILYPTNSPRPAFTMISYTDADASLPAGTVCLGANGPDTNNFSYEAPLKVYTIGTPIKAGIGFIGDSITAGYKGTVTPVQEIAEDALGRGIKTTNTVLSNKARNGTTIYDWNSSAALLQDAIKTDVQTGITTASFMLGTNDALQNYSADDYMKNMRNTIDAYLKPETGITKVVVHFSPSFSSNIDPNLNLGDPTVLNDRLLQYQEQILKLPGIYPGKVVIGDQTAFSYFENHPELYSPDGVHPNNDGYRALGDLWAPFLLK
jgi:lysophospholipase L1-like esterase